MSKFKIISKQLNKRHRPKPLIVEICTLKPITVLFLYTHLLRLICSCCALSFCSIGMNNGFHETRQWGVPITCKWPSVRDLNYMVEREIITLCLCFAFMHLHHCHLHSCILTCEVTEHCRYLCRKYFPFPEQTTSANITLEQKLCRHSQLQAWWKLVVCAQMSVRTKVFGDSRVWERLQSLSACNFLKFKILLELWGA